MLSPVRRLLCPVDFSPASRHVAAVAANFAQLLGAELIVLHVIEVATRIDGITIDVSCYDDIIPDLKARAAETMKRFVQSLGSEAEHVRTLLEVGPAREAILSVAQGVEADLIAMGTLGDRGQGHCFGSTAEFVVQRSRVPVLVVPLGELR